jgi:hypothetical protein
MLLPEHEYNSSLKWFGSANVAAQDQDDDGVKSFDELIRGYAPHIADSDEDNTMDLDEFYEHGPGPLILGLVSPSWIPSQNGSNPVWIVWSQGMDTNMPTFTLQRSSDNVTWQDVVTGGREYLGLEPPASVSAYRLVTATP